jgi:hypothetical protein
MPRGAMNGNTLPGSLSQYAEQTKAVAPIKDLGSVSRALRQQDDVIQSIHNVIYRLENELEPVLSPRPPQGHDAVASAPVEPLAISSRIDMFNGRLGSALERLLDLANRIDI